MSQGTHKNKKLQFQFFFESKGESTVHHHMSGREGTIKENGGEFQLGLNLTNTKWKLERRGRNGFKSFFFSVCYTVSYPFLIVAANTQAKIIPAN